MRAWSRLVAVLDTREHGAALAALRVALGLCLVGAAATFVRHGIVVDLLVDRSFGGVRALGHGPALVAWLGGPTPTVMRGLVAAALALGAMLTVGLGGRVTAFLALQVWMAIGRTNGHAGGAYDELLTNLLWLLVLSSSTTTASLDCWLRTGRVWSDDTVPSWPRWLVVFQIVVVYWSTGAQKISSHWVPGGAMSALYYILQQPSWHHHDMRWVASIYPVTQLATLVTWMFEVTAPALLLVTWARGSSSQGRLARLLRARDWRWLWIAVGLCLHAGVELVMNVGPFGFITVSAYLALFRGDEVKVWVERWTGRRGPATPSRKETPPLPAA